MMLYPDDHEVTLARAVGTEDESVQPIALYELDRRQQIDHLTSLYVPALVAPGSAQAFQEVVARLRAPGGCPWDRQQTHRSLRPYLLEEAYEVLHALDSEDTACLQEELGDLLLQILLHTQIAIEQGEFKMADVVAHIVTKLKRRHPHVFGQVRVSGAEEVLANWEQIKSEEKGQEQAEGSVAGVPHSLPALARAQALQRRAARRGFEREGMDSVWSRVEEGWQILRNAATGDSQETELGNLLFALVNLAGRLGFDAEASLREAVARFERRLQETERGSASRRQPPAGTDQ
jgi:tetrapyrrole methylase family protein/MazG family protein